MKKIIFSLAIFLCVTAILSGCTASPPMSAQEELVANEWQILTQSGECVAHLSFDGDNIKLKIDTADGGTVNIDECYELDENTVIIVSKTLGTVYIRYKIKGTELELIYEDTSMIFTKKPNS